MELFPLSAFRAIVPELNKVRHIKMDMIPYNDFKKMIASLGQEEVVKFHSHIYESKTVIDQFADSLRLSNANRMKFVATENTKPESDVFYVYYYRYTTSCKCGTIKPCVFLCTVS